MKGIKKLLTTTIALGVIAGCTTIPDESEQASLAEISDEQVSDWEFIPPVTHRTYRQDLDVQEPGALPDPLYDMPLSMNLDTTITVDNLVSLLEDKGLSLAVADPSITDQSVTIPRYDGSLGGFLAIMSEISDLSFRWSGNSLVVDSQGDYMVSVPQNEELLEGIRAAIEDIGAQEVNISQDAGLLSYSATQSRQKIIETYLDQLSTNTALINLQVAVVNVSLNQEQSSGLNWSSLSAQVGDIGLFEDEGGDEGSSASSQVAGELTGSSFDLVAQGSEVSIEGVLSLLSTYGESRTTQNLTLKTLSGIPVELRSGQTIPYIDEIDTDIRSGGETTISSTDISELETGFDVEISPFYDGASEIVTVNLEVNLKSLIGFRELVSESAAGAIRQPETRDQELNSIVRLEAGETALLGGLVYENSSDNRETLRGLEDTKSASQSKDTSNTALFILMRPTVTVYGPSHRVEGE